MKLSPTAYVILGMLRHKPRSGYEIKSAVDGTTRFFWAASYGQIYPELRRMEAAGLVTGDSRPQGGRKRTVYKLTRDGRRTLRRWLAEPTAVHELRDEGLLKLFFADAGDPGTAIEVLEDKQRLHEHKLAELREIEPRAAEAAAAGDPFPALVLRHGIEFSEWVAAWCGAAREELQRERDDDRRRKDV